MKEYSEKMKEKIGTIITFIIVGAAIFIVLAFSGVLPLKMYTVLSGSMEPTIPTGSLVFALDVKPEELVVEDILMFNPRETNMVMHRIVDIVETENGREFITRGDANNVNDPVPIYPQEVKGRVFGFVPYVGTGIQWIQQNIILVVAAIVGVIAAWTLIFERKKPNKDEKNPE